ncbi:hypothetical protein [Kordiimonas lacus]|uniref:Uncharacterized conserved protein n=1 Tax=Kordiimonas lacus TaxID=637679 RepID=A0A1G6WFL8_9PROT|nr:hypothetical protein [Kordiimonas lacus]SDD64589.1 Uncharacterized conserved protein [Kordiimonas lacus]
MPKFVFAYHGGPSSMTEEEGKAHMASWMDWMVGLGEAVLDRGHAVGKSHTVTGDGAVEGGGVNPISGYTLVQAVDMDAALKMAAVSPHVHVGGTIEVAPVLDMPM